MDMNKSGGLSAARIFFKGGWDGEGAQARRILYQAAEKWKRNKPAEFLLTPGGFIQFPWPDRLPEVGDVLHPNPGAVAGLIRSADRAVDNLLPPQLIEMLKLYTQMLILGVDSARDDAGYHIELTCALDLETGKRSWTGKSYPDHAQISRLIRNEDLGSHVIDHSGKTTLILGCHDLNIFNGRWGTREAELVGWRQEVRTGMRQILSDRSPSVVLHLAHTIDSVGTWRNGWSGLRGRLPPDAVCVSSGSFYREEGCRNSLSDVLHASLFGGASLDFIGAVDDSGNAYIENVAITFPDRPAPLADSRGVSPEENVHFHHLFEVFENDRRMRKGLDRVAKRKHQATYTFGPWKTAFEGSEIKIYYEFDYHPTVILTPRGEALRDQISVEFQIKTDETRALFDDVSSRAEAIRGLMPGVPAMRELHKYGWHQLEFYYPSETEPVDLILALKTLVLQTKGAVDEWIVSRASLKT